MAPDLRESLIPLSSTAFSEVLLKGALIENGMPRFNDFSSEQVLALKHYIRKMARNAVSAQ
jgi:quinohemoprotein ethanol dehydrogenase